MLKGVLKRIAHYPVREIGTNTFGFYSVPLKFDPKKDYFEILEVGKQATDADIKKAYYRLAKAYHPDSTPGKEHKFREISQAYSVLSNPQIKKQYCSSRSFEGFKKQVGRRARQKQYRYEDYQDLYRSYTPEQQSHIFEESKRKMKGVIFFGIGLFLFTIMLERQNQEKKQNTTVSQM